MNRSQNERIEAVGFSSAPPLAINACRRSRQSRAPGARIKDLVAGGLRFAAKAEGRGLPLVLIWTSSRELVAAGASCFCMRTHHVKTEPRHDHAPDTDDVWAWIVIGMISGGVMLAIWLPMLKLMLQA
jgi:hypothetical protein